MDDEAGRSRGLDGAGPTLAWEVRSCREALFQDPGDRVGQVIGYTEAGDVLLAEEGELLAAAPGLHQDRVSPHGERGQDVGGGIADEEAAP